MIRYTALQIEILQFLYRSLARRRSAIHLSAIAKELGRSKPGVGESLRDLERRKLVSSRLSGRMRFFSLSKEGEAFAWALSEPEQLSIVYRSRNLDPDKVLLPFIADADIALLQGHLSTFQRIFDMLHYDFLRESKGVNMIFLLDYSELFPLIDFGSSPVEDSIRYLFRKKPSSDMYVLPPPAAWEALHHILVVAGYAERYGDQESFLKNSNAKAFYETLKKPLPNPDALYSRLSYFYRRMGGLKKIIDFLDPQLPEKTREQTATLRRLVEGNTLTPLKSVVNGSKCEVDEATYGRVLSSLSSLRPHVTDSNIVDALNISLTHWLTDSMYVSRSQYFVHVTHSSIPFSIFERVKWEDDPFHVGVLVRDPNYMIARILCQEMFSDPDQASRYLGHGARIARDLLQNVNFLDFPSSPEALNPFVKTNKLFKTYFHDYYGKLILRILETNLKKRETAESENNKFPNEKVENMQHSLMDREEYTNRLIRAHEAIMRKFKDTYRLLRTRGFIDRYDDEPTLTY